MSGYDDLFTPPDDLMAPLTPANPAAPAPRKCRHNWATAINPDGSPLAGDPLATEAGQVIGYAPVWRCNRCGKWKNPEQARRGKNNRARGNREELTVARTVGGQKVGPLGHPWDVEMKGYARLQVKKLAVPPSLRTIAAELARIGSGAEMPGFVWVEPGRGGERLIVFRLADFAERHGVPTEDAA